MATPLKIREAIVRVHEQGKTYEEAAELLSVGRATVSRILRLQRENDSLEPRPRGGGNFSPITGDVERMLVALVEEKPDATVEELKDALVGRSGISTSRSAVQRTLLRLGFSRKKKASSPKSETRQSIEPVEKSSASSFRPQT